MPPLSQRKERKMAEVNFGKLFGTLNATKCEECGLRGADWIGNEDGGQNLCWECATEYGHSEPSFGCRGCDAPVARENASCGCPMS
jgi:hypothetical protein